MPILTIGVEEVPTHVIRPVVEQISKTFLREIGASSFFNGDKGNITLDLDFMSRDRTVDSEGRAAAMMDMCNIAVEYILNPNEMRWDPANGRNHQTYSQIAVTPGGQIPFFHDPIANVKITEHYVPTLARFTYTLTFTSIEDAHTVFETIHSRYHREARMTLHDISYTIPLTMNLCSVMLATYNLRSSINGTVGFLDYVKQNSPTGGIKFDVSTEKGPDGRPRTMEMVTRRHLLNCHGLIEIDQPAPEPQKEDRRTVRYQLTVTHTVQFNRPQSFQVTYPIIIENQPIPGPMRYRAPSTVRAAHTLPLDPVWWGRRDWFPRRPGLLDYPVHVPDYDDFVEIPHVLSSRKFHPLAYIAFMLDPGVTQIDMTQLGDELIIHPDVLRIMGAHGNDIFGYSGIFSLVVFSNDVQVDVAMLEYSADNVLTVHCTDTLKRYHIGLFEAQSLEMIDTKYATLMLENRHLFQITAMRNLNQLINRGIVDIDTTDATTNFFNSLQRSGRLVPYLERLITEGHDDGLVWGFLYPIQSLLDALSRYGSLKTNEPLFTIVAAWLYEDGVVPAGVTLRRFLRDSRTMTIVSSEAGGFHGSYAPPFRFFDATVNVSRSDRTVDV